MTVWEKILDIVTDCISLSIEEQEEIDALQYSDESCLKIISYITKTVYAAKQFIIEDNFTYKPIGVWNSLVEFLESKPKNEIMNGTVHDVFFKSGCITWSISHVDFSAEQTNYFSR